MGNFHIIKCPECSTNLETETVLDNCPVCKAYIKDRFYLQGGGTGIEPPKNAS